MGQPRQQRRLWPLLLLAGAALLQAGSLAWPAWAAFELGADWGIRAGQPQPLLQWLSLSLAVWLLHQAPNALRAGVWMWWFATVSGAATTWWLYISMVHYGALPAALGVLAVLALAGFLALIWFPVGYLWQRVQSRALAPLYFASAWLLAEWLRGVILTGFPWGNSATAHIDGLGVLAPWLGALGVGALVAGLAAFVATRTSLGAGVLALSGGALLVLPLWSWQAADWSQTRAAGEIGVTLLQGNIDQAEKFDGQSGVALALRWYRDAIAAAPPTDLVVAPETAIPVLPQTLGEDYWRELAQVLARRSGAVVMGIPLGSEQTGYENAIWLWTPERAQQALALAAVRGEDLAAHRYAKIHLVPFGEFTPRGFQWFAQRLNMPLSGFTAGDAQQTPLPWGGQRWGFQICYEDVFGAELAQRMARAEPTVWVNVSNIAWFGPTVAVAQHLNIARWRARELGRAVVRATNTGATAAIDHRGRVIAALPMFTRAVLSTRVQGREGLTPYVRWVGRWGDWPLVVLALLVGCWALRRR